MPTTPRKPGVPQTTVVRFFALLPLPRVQGYTYYDIASYPRHERRVKKHTVVHGTPGLLTHTHTIGTRPFLLPLKYEANLLHVHVIVVCKMGVHVYNVHILIHVLSPIHNCLLQFQMEQIDKYCRDHQDKLGRKFHLPGNDGAKELLYRHLLYDDHRKAMFCFVEKVGMWSITTIQCSGPIVTLM